MLLIFDWDGTISDSADKIVLCLQQAAASCGVSILSGAKIKNIIGLGLPEAMQRLYPELNELERERVKSSYVEHFLAADQVPSLFFEGVTEGLQQLKAWGFLLAVATGKSRRGLDRVLDNLELTDFFHASRCADETLSKPHPLMLNELLTELSVDTEQALMIGDTEYDMGMAQAIGMPRLAVTYGVHSVERLQKYEPVLCANHFSELVEWIEVNRDIK